jgi:hypothetical protein
VGHPARVGLDAHQPEPRIALEHAAEDERADDVLAAADDRHERVDLRPPHPERVLLARENVEAQGQAEVHRRLPQRVVHGIVVVRDARVAGHHDSPEAEGLDPLEVSDAVGDRAHRRLARADEPVGMGGAVLGDPQVVGVEARLLEIDVGMVAEHHADRRVEHLGRDAVALLVREARRRVPAATVHVVKARAELRQLLRRLARGGDQAHRDRLVDALDDEEIPALRIPDHVQRAVPEARLDPRRIGVRRLRDVRVGGDDRFRHGRLLCRSGNWLTERGVGSTLRETPPVVKPHGVLVA